MTAPNVKPINLFPKAGMIPTTYPEYVNKLKCTCPGGAIIKPSPLPSATKNLGDVIADQARLLSAFTSAYGMITVVIRMIACIIEVLCALMNPFAVIAAIIKLFGTCLPDFILIFPQLAIPAIIICIIKIILAIIEYILTVIVPLIKDILKNINMLIDAFAYNNHDAQLAIAFKIASLFKNLQNILGILAALGALWEMIKALLALGIAIPCGGSDSCCNDSNCPPTLKENTSLTGNDGILTVFYTYEIPLMYFTAPSIVNDLKSIQDFFPSGFDYISVTDKDKLPYLLTVDNTNFAVSGVNDGGTATLLLTDANYYKDGYLANTDRYGLPLTTTEARFHTYRKTFQPSYAGTRYLILQDTRGATQAANNNGTWLIQSVYDSYDVLLQKTGTLTWSYQTGNTDLKWSLAPQLGTGKKFDLEIHHEVLLGQNLIGVGCHPAVRAVIGGINNRFPQLKDTVLPALPDLNALIANLTACITAVAPLDINSDWVLDNYGTLAANMVGLESCVTNNLNNFKNDMIDYLKQIIDKVLNLENSILVAEPSVQMIGNYADINVIPMDKNGAVLALGLPPGTLTVEVNTSEGELSSTEEILDAYGVSTGVFAATITSPYAVTAQIGATIDGYDVAYFDGYSLQPRYVYVQFVEPSDYRILTEGSVEPLGVGRA